MKPASLIFLLLYSFSSFAQYKSDSTEIVNLLASDYATMATWNAYEHAQNCTADYLLIENGEIWDLPKELEYYHSKASSKTTRKDKFLFRNVKVYGNMGYAVYDLHSDIIENGTLKSYHWYESVMFRKLNNRWKIALIHSTPVNANPAQTQVAIEDMTPRVTGIGGIFFGSKNPNLVRDWYGKNLGLAISADGSPFEFRNANRPDEINYLIWEPFNPGKGFFKPSEKEFMINYRVQHIDDLLVKLKASNVRILDSVEKVDYGKFVHIMDPEGNKIELWEPVDSVFTKMGAKTTK
jgi:predicted enzyme related to lactoylglutathione lyase